MKLEETMLAFKIATTWTLLSFFACFFNYACSRVSNGPNQLSES